jgi:hypothetical protein
MLKWMLLTTTVNVLCIMHVELVMSGACKFCWMLELVSVGLSA